MFDENSGLVLVWLDLIKKGEKTLADVPHVSNLYEVIAGLVNGEAEEPEPADEESPAEKPVD